MPSNSPSRSRIYLMDWFWLHQFCHFNMTGRNTPIGKLLTAVTPTSRLFKSWAGNICSAVGEAMKLPARPQNNPVQCGWRRWREEKTSTVYAWEWRILSQFPAKFGISANYFIPWKLRISSLDEYPNSTRWSILSSFGAFNMRNYVAHISAENSLQFRIAHIEKCWCARSYFRAAQPMLWGSHKE